MTCKLYSNKGLKGVVMTEYGLGYVLGIVTFSVLVLWIGIKGFSKAGIPITKKLAAKGWIGKIIGTLFIIWGAVGIVNALIILVG